MHRRTPLFETHRAMGAKMAPFAGYEMPIHYTTGAIAEHHLVRTGCGLFDTSHMGRFRVRGADAAKVLDRLLSANVTMLRHGFSTYALMLGADGGVIDDVFVYRPPREPAVEATGTGPSEDSEYLVVVNAANRDGDLAHLASAIDSDRCEIDDETDRTAMIAIQGPSAATILRDAAQEVPPLMPRFAAAYVRIADGNVLAARTGYTGEDGYELFTGADHATTLWQSLLDAAKRLDTPCGPAGLAARDSLRFEVGFPLYGHEIDRDHTPVESLLTWACDLQKPFLGRDAVVEAQRSKPARRLATIVLDERAVPRPGMSVVDEAGANVGTVVSGMYCPTIGAAAANVFVDRAVSRAGTPLGIDIRGRARRGSIAKRPLYRPTYRDRSLSDELSPDRRYAGRHIGVDAESASTMLANLRVGSLEQLIDEAVPAAIRLAKQPDLPQPSTEDAIRRDLQKLAQMNRPARCFLGDGFYPTLMPEVIRKTILDNPAWYTQYTPYQAEIAQGRLEALLNFQTMITDLTGLDVANASLLDEASAAAEAVALCLRAHRPARHESAESPAFVAIGSIRARTLGVVATRAQAIGVRVVSLPAPPATLPEGTIGVLVQYPDAAGSALPPDEAAHLAKAADVPFVVATDPLALTVLKDPGSFGADVAIGSVQRFGLPMWYGGPHAAFMAVRERYRRLLPGRLVGVSKDRHGRSAMRLSLQTREQHIRRDKATSNICTAQALPAILASMFAVYHGPQGLQAIALRVRGWTRVVATTLSQAGFDVGSSAGFDTVTIRTDRASEVVQRAQKERILLAQPEPDTVRLSLDETSDVATVCDLLALFGVPESERPTEALTAAWDREVSSIPADVRRRRRFLDHPVFHSHRTETKMMRYIRRLEEKDLSLVHSMIPLGSCTMKLNGAVEMSGLGDAGFVDVHPDAPQEYAQGYVELVRRISEYLGEITGLPAVSVQPNSGAQGEYAGLLAIRRFHSARGDERRTVCLIPESAHGTNPASAVSAGFEIVVVRCTPSGDIDVADLGAKASAAGERLGALMVTYPSTHGVFEDSIRELINLVHREGGLVYMDGANLNAQIGITSPGRLGADVCHVNLHKTFAIPHGGGGPGVGPICAVESLRDCLPGNPNDLAGGAVAATRFGSAGILSISYAYIRLLGAPGLRRVTECAILGANYVAVRLKEDYPLLYTNDHGRVAHECIIDMRPLTKRTGITAEDVAKRLMDYGFHAPTMEWPVAGTLMIEPTESESRDELDRFCDAMHAIRREIDRVERGEWPRDDNPLVFAPHTVHEVTAESWEHPYDRETAAFPLEWVRERKFWPSVARIDGAYGDRNPVCTCPSPREFATPTPAAAFATLSE